MAWHTLNRTPQKQDQQGEQDVDRTVLSIHLVVVYTSLHKNVYHVSNAKVLQRQGQSGVLDPEMIRRQEKWKRRLEVMDNSRSTKRVYEGVMEGKKP